MALVGVELETLVFEPETVNNANRRSVQLPSKTVTR